MGRTTTDEFAYDYRHNSFGFRDVEHTLVKGAGTFRMLGLGDSFTYGVGVTFEETYLYRREGMLNDRAGAHPRVEVIKAGIPRYFPEPERIRLEKYGVQFQPAWVVVGFLPKDVLDTYLGLDAARVDQAGYLKPREAEELGSFGTQVYRYSHLCRVLLRSYVSWQIERKFRPRRNELFQEGGFHAKDWVQVEREDDQMAAIAASIGARVVIVHIPQKGPWTEKHRDPAVRLSPWAAARNVGFVDLLPAMERISARAAPVLCKGRAWHAGRARSDCPGVIQGPDRAEPHPLGVGALTAHPGAAADAAHSRRAAELCAFGVDPTETSEQDAGGSQFN